MGLSYISPLIVIFFSASFSIWTIVAAVARAASSGSG